MIPRSMIINAAMPMSQKFMFKYENINTNNVDLIGPTPFAFKLFRINSLNAINTTGGNGGIPGYINWTKFYNRYAVHWAKITCEFINNSIEPCYVGIAFRPITMETSWNSWSQYRNIDSNTFPNQQVLLTPRNGSKDSCTLSVQCKLDTLWGLPSQHNGSLAFTSDINANPPTIQDAIIFALSGNGSAINANIITRISIDMIATMYQSNAQFNNSTV